MPAGNRTGRYLVPTSAGHCPASVVAVVVEPTAAAQVPDTPSVMPVQFGRVHVSYGRRDHGQWTATAARTFDRSDDFWAWLERWTFPGRKSYIFSPLASDALTLLRFWGRVDRIGGKYKRQTKKRTPVEGEVPTTPAFVFDRLVLRGVPDIVEYAFNGKNYVWLSLAQFFPLSDDELAAAVGFERPSVYLPHSQPAKQTWTHIEKASLAFKAARTLGEWWAELKAGGFQRTVGGMAKSFLLSRITPKTVTTHTDARAIKLERMACHGGRASTWYYGTCDGRKSAQKRESKSPLPAGKWSSTERLYQVDVRSMYPFLLSQIRTPVSLASIPQDMTAAGLEQSMRGMCAVAYVTIQTDVAEYPCRRGEFVIYPVGTFRTTLCGVELASALRQGSVRQVHQCVLYRAGKPFAGAASELLRMRRDARDTGNKGWETFVKLLSNSLTGKFAQRSGMWIPRTDVHAEYHWGEWPVYRGPGKQPTRRRARAGMVEELDRENDGAGLMPAVYAHITSAGRDMMRQLRSLCPARSVVSQDTDGLWVTRAGLNALEEHPELWGEEPGRLRVVGESSLSRFFSPKHYYASDSWTLAGLHNPNTTAAGVTWDDTYTRNNIRQASDGPPAIIEIITRSVTLSTIPHDGEVGDAGWQVPARLPLRSTAMPLPPIDQTTEVQGEIDWDAYEAGGIG